MVKHHCIPQDYPDMRNHNFLCVGLPEEQASFCHILPTLDNKGGSTSGTMWWQMFEAFLTAHGSTASAFHSFLLCYLCYTTLTFDQVPATGSMVLCHCFSL